MVLKHLSELKELLVDKPTRRLVLAAAQDHNSLIVSFAGSTGWFY